MYAFWDLYLHSSTETNHKELWVNYTFYPYIKWFLD